MIYDAAEQWIDRILIIGRDVLLVSIFLLIIIGHRLITGRSFFAENPAEDKQKRSLQ